MRIGKYEASDKSSIGTAITFLLIGLGAGAAVALLFAPKSGKQLRRDVRRQYDDTVDMLDGWKEGVKARAEKVVERGSEWADELKESAREKVAPVKEALRRE